MNTLNVDAGTACLISNMHMPRLLLLIMRAHHALAGIKAARGATNSSSNLQAGVVLKVTVGLVSGCLVNSAQAVAKKMD